VGAQSSDQLAATRAMRAFLFCFFPKRDRLYYIRTLHPDPPLLHKGPCKMRKIQTGPDHLLQRAASPAIGRNEAESNHLHSISTQALGMPQDSAAQDSPGHNLALWTIVGRLLATEDGGTETVYAAPESDAETPVQQSKQADENAGVLDTEPTKGRDQISIPMKTSKKPMGSKSLLQPPLEKTPEPTPSPPPDKRRRWRILHATSPACSTTSSTKEEQRNKRERWHLIRRTDRWWRDAAKT
jgi:hypothetical protein